MGALEPQRLDRRAFLRTTGAAAAVGGLALAGCSSAPSASGPTTTFAPTRLRHPGSLPNPHLPAGTDTIPEIDHIVVVMMENHSFDNYLGVLGRGDGLTRGADGLPVNTNPDPSGGYVRSFRMPSACQASDHPSQSWNASHISYNGGRNNGFVRAPGCGPVSMGYWNEEDLPFYYGLARTFPIGDRYFSSVLGQTYPNRRYLMAGTSLGMVATILDVKALNVRPPNGTVFDLLNAHGVTWKDYYTDLPSIELFIPVANEPANKAKTVPIQQFFTDAAAGSLSQFSLVEPDYLRSSEENPQDVQAGEAFVASVVNAVMSGPSWPKTVLIWNYDEGGGYYDHVPPPAAPAPDDVPPAIQVPPDQPGGFDRYGFRVPCAVVSPYSRRDYVSHVVHDHTSVLKLVETKWNLPALTYRDANASNMLDFLDLSAGSPPFREPPVLPAPAAQAQDRVAPVTCTPTPLSAFPPAGARVSSPAATA